MRKLASFQTVNAVEPIPNADSIEKVRVLGWWVVAKKGEFRPGDRVVYCEIDSLLPQRPEFEFLRTSSYRPAVVENGVETQPAGFRVKTVRLRGQVSQGICFRPDLLPAGLEPVEDGADVSAALGIIKYEPPAPAWFGGGSRNPLRTRGPLPGFVPKTDETRVQVLEPVLERHRGKTFHLSEKLDGASMTAFLRGWVFGVCSRNLWLDETDYRHILCRLAVKLSLADRLAGMRDRLGVAVAVQGEAIGPGIQGNKYGLPEVGLRVFNVLDLDAGRLLDLPDLLAAVAAVGLEAVPQLGELVLEHTVDSLVEMSVGPSLLNPSVRREGIVLRPAREEFDPDLGGRLSFKVINPQFLLKYDE